MLRLIIDSNFGFVVKEIILKLNFSPSIIENKTVFFQVNAHLDTFLRCSKILNIARASLNFGYRCS